MDTAALVIDRWHNEISVASGHPDPNRVRDHLDKLTHHVPVPLERALEGYLRRHEDEVILVRSIEFTMDLDTACDLDTAARLLAKRFTRELVERIESNAPSVVRFASQAAYAAHFIDDLARGRAWGQWYYAQFDGLKLLPAGAAIRTLLVDDAVIGRLVLAQIPTDAWPHIASTLDTADTLRIVRELLDTAAVVDGAQLFDEARRIGDALPAAGGIAPAPLALTIIADLLRAGLTFAPAVVRTAEVLAILSASLSSGDPKTIAHWREAIGEPADRRLFDCVPQHLRIATLGAFRDLIGTIVAARKERSTREPAAGPAVEAQWDTAFAGFILLIDELDRLLEERMTPALPLIDAIPARGAVALAILACTAGRGRGALLWQDSAWRSMLGVDPGLSCDDFTAALLGSGDASGALGMLADAVQDDPSPAAAAGIRADWRHLDIGLLRHGCTRTWRRFFLVAGHEVCRRLARRIPGMTGCSLPYLRANLLSAHGSLGQPGPGWFRIEVRRPPLHVLIAMTGMARGARMWRGPSTARIDIEYT